MPSIRVSHYVNVSKGVKRVAFIDLDFIRRSETVYYSINTKKEIRKGTFFLPGLCVICLSWPELLRKIYLWFLENSLAAFWQIQIQICAFKRHAVFSSSSFHLILNTIHYRMHCTTECRSPVFPEVRAQHMNPQT